MPEYLEEAAIVLFEARGRESFSHGAVTRIGIAAETTTGAIITTDLVLRKWYTINYGFPKDSDTLLLVLQIC